MEYVAPSDMNEKLKIQLLRDEQVLRHIVIKLDKYAVEYNTKKEKWCIYRNRKSSGGLISWQKQMRSST